MINLNNADINSVIYNNTIVNSVYLNNVLVFSNSKIITIVFGNAYVARVTYTITTPKNDTITGSISYSSSPVNIEVPYNSKINLYALAIADTEDTDYTVASANRTIYPVTQDQTVTFIGSSGVRQYSVYFWCGTFWNSLRYDYGEDALQGVPSTSTKYVASIEKSSAVQFMGWSLTEDGEVLTELIVTQEYNVYPIFKEVGSGLAFTLSADGTYYICSGFGTNRSTNLVIPAGYNGLPVLEIAENAFLGGKSTGSGNLGQPMYYIPQSVTIINGVQKIGNGAFSGCEGLTTVKIPSSVKYLGSEVFYNYRYTPLIHVEIRGSLTYAGDYAFGYQDNMDVLRDNAAQQDGSGGYYLGYTAKNGDFVENYLLDISDNYTSITVNVNTDIIGSGACVGNDNLQSITLNKYLKHICGDAFQSCSNLSQITYKGTMAEWAAVTKGNDWILWCPNVSVITCSDGTVPI